MVISEQSCGRTSQIAVPIGGMFQPLLLSPSECHTLLAPLHAPSNASISGATALIFRDGNGISVPHKGMRKR